MWRENSEERVKQLRRYKMAIVAMAVLVVVSTAMITSVAAYYIKEEGHWFNDDYGWGRIRVDNYPVNGYYTVRFEYHFISNPANGQQEIYWMRLVINKEQPGTEIWGLQIISNGYYYDPYTNFWYILKSRYIDVSATVTVSKDSSGSGWYDAYIAWLVRGFGGYFFPVVKFYLTA
jgi:hypothetical protein